MNTLRDNESIILGISDEITEGTFRYGSNDEEIAWANWRPGQPNNRNGNEDYAQLAQDGTWYDINGGNTGTAICMQPYQPQVEVFYFSQN